MFVTFLANVFLDIGIENLLDNASQITALSKLYIDSLKMIHCDLGISVLWQHYTGSNLSI